MPYYDRFESQPLTKNWDKVLFIPGKVAQAAELNEIQSILNYKLFQMGEAIWNEGDIISGCGYSIDGTSVTVDGGLLFIQGAVRQIPGTTTPITISGVGEEYIGVAAIDVTVTENEDSDLRDPAVGQSNYDKSGAHRRTYNYVWFKCSGDGTDGAVPVIHLLDGEPKIIEKPTEYSEIMKVMHRRTYDESGNYTVAEFGLSLEWVTEPNTVALVLDKGKAYVEGVEIETGGKRRVPFTVNNDYETVLTESLDSYSSSQTLYKLDMPYVKKINRLSAQVTGVITLSRGSGNTDEILAQAKSQISQDISSLVDIRGVAQGAGATYDFDTDAWSGATTVYSVTASWFKDGTAINWSPLGPEPSYTSSYKVAAYFDKVLTKGVRTLTTVPTPQAVTKSVRMDSPTSLTLTPTGGDTAKYTYKVTAVTDLGETLPVTNTLVNGPSNFDSTHKVALSWAAPSNLGSANVPSLVKYRVYRNVKNSNTFGLLAEVTGSTSYMDDGSSTLIPNFLPPTRNTTGRDSLPHTDIFQVTAIGNTSGASDYSSVTDFMIIKGNNPGVTDVPSKNYALTLGNGIIDWLGGNEPSGGATYYVTYQYWAHTVEGDYVGADSYSSFTDAPFYTNTASSTLERLTNYIDFRTSGTKPRAGSQPTCEYEFYVGRKDLIYLTSEGNFLSLTGAPARYPTEPPKPARALPITYLVIPPYVYDKSEIVISAIPTKRYTMLDIRTLERRISQLEYYQAVDQLDKEAIGVETGSSNLRKGIFTDLFTGHGKGDVYHPLYLCSIDSVDRVLKLPFDMDHRDGADYINLSGVSVPVTINDKSISLPFTHTEYIKQPLATESKNVNPYDVFDWVGSIRIVPESDTWVDTVTLPDLKVNFEGNNNNYNTPIWSNTTWGEWKNISLGVNANLNNKSTMAALQQAFSSLKLGEAAQQEILNLPVLQGSHTNLNTTIGAQEGSTTTISLVPEQITKSIGDRVLDISKAPWIRSRVIEVRGTALKPNHDFKVFFDNVEMDIYTTTPGDLGSPGNTKVTSTSAGNFTCKFTIPAARFKTGTIEVKITSADGSNTSYGSAKYVAEGLIQTKQETFMSVTMPNLAIETESLVQTRVTQTGWNDPLAETFLTGNEMVYISSIDLYFRTKDPSIPCTVEIRNVVNGYPGKQVLGTSTLQPSAIHLSEDASVATNFTFADPVVLNPNTEYCFVIWAKSTAYEVWVSVLGNKDVLTGERVIKQPYAGVMFASSNGSTWNADQLADIKFTLYRCNFQSTAQLVFDSFTGLQAYLFALNTTQILPSGSVVRWSYSLDGGGSWVPFEPLIDMALSGIFTTIKLKADFLTLSPLISPLINSERFGFITVLYRSSGTYVTGLIDFDTPCSELHVYLQQALNGQSIGLQVELEDSGEWLPLGSPSGSTSVENDDLYTEAFWNVPITEVAGKGSYTSDKAYKFYYDTTDGKTYYGNYSTSSWEELPYIINGEFKKSRVRIDMSTVSRAVSPYAKKLRIIYTGV